MHILFCLGKWGKTRKKKDRQLGDFPVPGGYRRQFVTKRQAGDIYYILFFLFFYL